MFIVCEEVQPMNAEKPTNVTLVGIVILVRFVQPENVLLSIAITLEGISMTVKLNAPAQSSL